MKRKQVGWNVIRAEYIKDESTSYRKLADKYSVSLKTLTDRAIREKWVELRKQKRDKNVAKFIEKTSDKESTLQVSINDVANDLLKQISEVLKNASLINSQSIKQLTSALKDLKDIKGNQVDDQDEKATGVVFLPSVASTSADEEIGNEQ